MPPKSVVTELPSPEAIHRELLDTLKHAQTLRRLLRLSQKRKPAIAQDAQPTNSKAVKNAD